MSERILIVDDDPQLRRTLSDILRIQGYAPLTADSGREALEQTRTLGDDLAVALVDLYLPDMDGLDVIAAIQRQAPAAEIIVLTGRASVESAVAALRGRTFDYLQKPAPPELLLATIGRARERRARRKAEAALQESEERFRTLVETATDAIIMIDADERVRLFNRAAERIFGYAAPEIVGQDIAILIPEEYAERHRAAIHRHLKTGQTTILGQTVELKGLRQGGEVFPLELSLSEMRVGDKVTFTGVIRDISRRARAEAEIHRRAAHLEALNAIIAAATAAPNLPHLLETALDHTLRALELEMGAIWVAGQHVERNLPPEIAQAIVQAGQAAGLEGRPMPPMAMADWEQAAIVPPAPAHAHRWLQVLAPVAARFGIRASLMVPILAEKRYVGGLSLSAPEPRAWSGEEVALAEAVGCQLGTAVERLRLLDQIQEQAHQVQQIVDTVPEGVLLLDGDGRIVLANPTAQIYLPMLGDAGVGDRLTRLGDHSLATLREKPPADRLWHEVRTDDGRRIFEAVARPVAVKARAEGWVLVLRDITQEREHQQYLQAQERLATVGQLAAGIAHDFNNIMGAIVLYTQMLTRNPNLSARENQYLATIHDQAHYAAKLIHQILDFSRRSILERRPMDLLPFVKELVKMLERMLPEKIGVTMDYSQGEYLVNADPTRLQQVLMNLALNARDAMPDGGALRFALSHLALVPGQPPPLPGMAAGDWMCITVADNGSGIPADVLPHIFDPFFTTKPPGQGTGLGLAQVYGIIKQHGGEIAVDSQVGEGAVFTIYLPVLGIPQPATPAPEAPQIPGGAETILVVEDNPVTGRAVQVTLEGLGYNVLRAADGPEALALFAEQGETIDLVLSDMVMPQMDGLELYRTLKARHPDVKVMIATGYPLEDGGKALMEEGVVAWLQKPFPVERLAATLRQALEG